MNNNVASETIISFLASKDMLLANNTVRTKVNQVKALNTPQAKALYWIREKKHSLDGISKSICLVPKGFQIASATNTIIEVTNPQLAFIYVFNQFFAPPTPSRQIATTAVLDPSVIVGEEVHIMDHVVIGAEVTIGNRVTIHPNVAIYGHTTIEDNVVIHAGSCIGKEGFGFIRDEEGNFIQFPHIGKVIIQENVEIGANCVIDRGALQDTIIGKDSKIDSLCQIAHNAQIGSHNLMTATATIAGSVTTQNNVYMAPNSSIVNPVEVGEGALIGAGATVKKKVKEKETITCFDSKPIEDIADIVNWIKKKRKDEGKY